MTMHVKSAVLPATKQFKLPRSALFQFEDIDQEHQKLIDILNETMLPSERNRRVEGTHFVLHIRILLDHLIEHFANEEGIMAETCYPGLAEHRAHHATIKDGIGTMLAEALLRSDIPVESVHDLFDRLVDELLRFDLMFKSYPEGNGFIKKR
jgi:hemerythrin-like metal-binding protein